MYEIESLNRKGERIVFLNKNKSMLIKEDYHINLYEIAEQKKYKLLDKIAYSDGIIDFTMLSNEMIITSGRHTIIIYKKDKNSSYKLHQKIFNTNWAEIYRIKELENKNFAVCGWAGFFIFKINDYSQYNIILEINYTRIYDFMEIKGKKNNFILYSGDKALIINGKDIINIINLENNILKNFSNSRYICQLNESLFVLSGLRYITLFNSDTNQIKKINFLKDDDFDKRREKYFLNHCPNIFRYNSSSIILITLEGIFIIKVINEEKIQVQLRIFHKLIYGFDFEFNEEEKSIIYYDKNTFWNKLKIKNKYIVK